jgi:hypothetical protein
MQPLPIPEGAETDEDAVEIARVWIAGGNQHVSLATGVWDDPAAWGILLVDLARHIAAAYGTTTAMTPQAVLARIRSGFDAEWSSPPDIPRGSSDN